MKTDTTLAINIVDIESHAKNLRSRTLMALLAGWVRWLVRVWAVIERGRRERYRDIDFPVNPLPQAGRDASPRQEFPNGTLSYRRGTQG